MCFSKVFRNCQRLKLIKKMSCLIEIPLVHEIACKCLLHSFEHQ